MANYHDQYHLAWEKFLELVIFEQKSDALGLAKLLGYNLNDKILSIQLQADLYWYFKEIDRAKELYKKAYDLYIQNLMENRAFAIAEHLKLLS